MGFEFCDLGSGLLVCGGSGVVVLGCGCFVFFGGFACFEFAACRLCLCWAFIVDFRFGRFGVLSVLFYVGVLMPGF